MRATNKSSSWTKKVNGRQPGEEREKNTLGKTRSCMWESPELGETEIYSGINGSIIWLEW